MCLLMVMRPLSKLKVVSAGILLMNGVADKETMDFVRIYHYTVYVKIFFGKREGAFNFCYETQRFLDCDSMHNFGVI